MSKEELEDDYWTMRETDAINNSIENKKLKQRIAELEEQLKNAIVLPISVGQEIYYLYKEDIDGDVNYTIDKGLVFSFSFGIDSNWFFAIYDSGLSYWHLLEDFNSEVFATKEEAQAKLKELQSNDN